MEELKEFINYLKIEKRYSGYTVRAYSDDIAQFNLYLELEKSVQDIFTVVQSDLRDWIIFQVQSGNSPRTLRRKVASIKAFYEYFMRKGLLKINPAEGMILPKMKKKLPDFINEKSIESLLDQKMFSTNFPGIRDRFVLELFYATGIRLSELVNLKNSDVDLIKGEIKVLGKRNKERLVPLTGNIIQLYQNYNNLRKITFPEENGDRLIINDKGLPVYPRLVQRLVRKYLSMGTTLEKRSPHLLRHTFATHMLNNGADLNAVKELLGHANLAATEIYTHNTYEKLKTIYKQAHPRA
jgi:integrase/recombinase XerC